MNPECSHCVAYSYLWPVVMNVSWSSLHSTLYTVWVQVVFRGRAKCWAHRPPRILRSQPPVRGRSRRGASIAWCFHPASNRQKGDEMTSQKRRRETCRDVRLTFWQQSMNSSMVTTPSLFLSIFCRRENGRLKRRFKGSFCRWNCRPLTCLEEHFYVLTGCLLFEDGVRAFPHHVVDGLHDVQHFLQEKG